MSVIPRKKHTMQDAVFEKLKSFADLPKTVPVYHVQGQRCLLTRDVAAALYKPTNFDELVSNGASERELLFVINSTGSSRTTIIRKHAPEFWSGGVQPLDIAPYGQKAFYIPIDTQLIPLIVKMAELDPTNSRLKDIMAMVNNSATNATANAANDNDMMDEDKEVDDDDDEPMGINSLSAMFAEIRPGTKMRTTNETPQRVSAIDLVMVVSGHNYCAAKKTIYAKVPDCPTTK